MRRFVISVSTLIDTLMHGGHASARVVDGMRGTKENFGVTQLVHNKPGREVFKRQVCRTMQRNHIEIARDYLPSLQTILIR